MAASWPSARAATSRPAAHAPEIVDLHGAALLPAFIDPHSHLSSVAMGLQQAAVEGARDYADLIERIQRYIRENNVPAGQWVTAHGYDHNALAEHRPPTREVLDKAAPENPLVLQHASGQRGCSTRRRCRRWAGRRHARPPTAAALAARRTAPLTGYAVGERLYRDDQAHPPRTGGAQLLDCYRRAQQLYASFGIATVQDGLIVDQTAPLYEALVQTGTLFLDTVGYADFRSCEALHTRLPAHWDGYRGRFRIGGYKTFLDGSPQARTAWLRQPYVPADGQDESYCGYPALPDDVLFAQLVRALREGRQVLAHCNGDAAAAQYLAQFARAPKPPAPVRPACARS